MATGNASTLDFSKVPYYDRRLPEVNAFDREARHWELQSEHFPRPTQNIIDRFKTQLSSMHWLRLGGYEVLHSADGQVESVEFSGWINQSRFGIAIKKSDIGQVVFDASQQVKPGSSGLIDLFTLGFLSAVHPKYEGSWTDFRSKAQDLAKMYANLM